MITEAEPDTKILCDSLNKDNGKLPKIVHPFDDIFVKSLYTNQPDLVHHRRNRFIAENHIPASVAVLLANWNDKSIFHPL